MTTRKEKNVTIITISTMGRDTTIKRSVTPKDFEQEII